MSPHTRRPASDQLPFGGALRSAWAGRLAHGAAVVGSVLNRITCRVRGHAGLRPERDAAGRPVYRCGDCGYTRPRVGPILMGRQWH